MATLISSTLANTTFSLDGWYGWTLQSDAGTNELGRSGTVILLDATVVLAAGSSAMGVNPYYASAREAASAVGSLADGGYVVTWVSSNRHDGYISGLYAQRFDAFGQHLGDEILVNPGIRSKVDAYASDSTVTGLDDGGWMVSVRDPYGNISNQRFDAAGNLVGSMIEAGEGYRADVAVLSDGTYVSSWVSGELLLFQKFNADGSSDSAAVELGAAVISSDEQKPVSVAALPDAGGFVVAWTSKLGPDQNIVASFVDYAGDTVGDPVMVSAGTGVRSNQAVTTLANGDVIVVWQASDGVRNDEGVFAQRLGSDGAKLGEAVIVNTTLAYKQGVPDVVGLKDGGYVVAWQSDRQTMPYEYPATGYGIFLQRFDSNGVALGAETRVVSSGRFGDNHTDAALTALPEGGYVVSWTDNTGGSYPQTYIQSQRFDADGKPHMFSINGDAGHNVINYVSSSDPVRLYGGIGNDSLTGGSLGDVFEGGSGNDTLVGGRGDDVYTWQLGDTIVELADGGIDTVNVNQTYTLTSRYLENATLTGTAKADLIGNVAANELRGNSADNVLDGGEGADTLVGGAGSDTFLVDHVGDRVKEGPALGGGIDNVVSAVSFTLDVNVENLELRGTAALNGTGNASNNRLLGNDQDNRLDGAGGNDTMEGGLGNDTYVVGASGDDSYFEYAGEGTDTLEIDSSWTLNSSLDSIENLTLWGTGNFTATGDGGANVLKGNQGNNVLDGKAGADTMDGGWGNDIYIVRDTTDHASEVTYPFDGGLDLVKTLVSHTLGANIENLSLTGNNGISGKGNERDNLITGNASGNRLEGLMGVDTLVGGAGNDTLVSTDGLDVLKGGIGNDTYLVNSSTDEAVELSGQGTDTVVATVARAYTLNAHFENLQLVGSDVDGLGNTLANRITGTAGNNLLDGGAGNDVLIGLAGNDSYIVNSVGDQIVEGSGAGTDEVFSSVTLTLAEFVERLTLTGNLALNGTGNTLANRLTGNDAANSLSGGGGNDQLTGKGGNDKLTGGAGADTLNGGSGADIFRFSSALNASTNVDILSDFNVADDTIQLENSVFNAFTATGSMAIDNLRAGNGFTTAADANDFVIYNRSTGTLYYDADGSGTASTAIKFAVLASGLSLTSADFVLT